MKKINNKSKELQDRLARALADYQNLEKRIEREKEDFVKFTNALLLGRLLPILDNLEKVEVSLSDQALKMAVNELRLILKNEGVVEIETQGRKFEAQEMECVEKVKGLEGTIVDVYQKGYKLNGKVLRPAKVKVGAGKKEVKNE